MEAQVIQDNTTKMVRLFKVCHCGRFSNHNNCSILSEQKFR